MVPLRPDQSPANESRTLHQVAQDPATSAEQLARLQRDRSRFVREAVAANPNLGVDEFTTAALGFPEAVLNNPILDWRLLEDANWLEDLDARARHRLICSPTAPVSMLWWAARFGTPQDQLSVIANPASPPDLLRWIIGQDKDGNARVAQQHRALLASAHTPSEINRSGDQVDSMTFAADLERVSLAKTPAISFAEHTAADELRMLSAGGFSSEAIVLMSCSTLPEWMQPVLANADIETRRMLSKHIDATAPSLQTLAFDDEVDIRSRVAERANLPEETRALLSLLGQLPAHAAHSQPGLAALNTTALRTLSPLGGRESTEHRGRTEHTEKQNKHTEKQSERTEILGRMTEIANVSAYLGAKFRETTQSLPQRWIAAHPLAPESVLAEAVVSHDWHVREAAARNPSITLQIAAIALLDSDKDVRVALALNSSCPPEFLSILQTDSHEGVREATSQNPRCNETEPHVVQLQTRRLLNKLAKQNPAIRRVLARIPDQSVAEQRAFALDAQWEVRLACASNPQTDASVLTLLCGDPDVDVRKAVGAHRNLSAVTRLTLLSDEQPAVREALIAHADDDALHRLSRDDSVTVRSVVASNPRATAAILARLSEDNDASVREFVALHPKTPLGARLRLAASEEPGVKRAVLKWASEVDMEGQGAAPRPGERAPEADAEIRHEPRREQTQVIAVLLGGNAGDSQTWARLREGDPTLSRAKLHRLAYATDWGSESFIGPKTAPNALTVLATFNDWRLRQAVARHPATPEQTVALLTRDSDYDVRTSAAAHPCLRQRDLKRLSIDPHFAVRLAIAERPGTPQSVLDAMVFDDTDHVREAVLNNPQLSKDALSLHDGVMHGTFVTQRALTKLAKGNSMLRKLIASHPMCPAKLRGELATDDDWRIREAVANNECSESEVLESMGEDSDRDVRGAVARHANTPLHVLVNLSGDTDHTVRTAVLANPKLVESQRQACLVSAYRRTLISELPTDRIASLLSPLCSARHLNRRSTWQSPQWLERFVAASHPLVTRAVLERLCSDAHTAVFQQANSSMMQREPLAGAKPSADAESTPKGSGDK